MVVFASMTSAMIDLSKTNSKGVAGRKPFWNSRRRARRRSPSTRKNCRAQRAASANISRANLKTYGYECRYDVGISEFKIDCAVVDPKNKKRFILAILCDGSTAFRSSAKDRCILQTQILKHNNWNVVRLFSINFINNPKREIKRIKDILDRLTGVEKQTRDYLTKYKKAYRYAKLEQQNNLAQFVTSGENDAEIVARLKAIASAEEPFSEQFLMKRCLNSLGVLKYGAKVEERMLNLINLCELKRETLCGKTYLRKTDKCLDSDFTATRRASRSVRPNKISRLTRSSHSSKGFWKTKSVCIATN